jgi:hypothetical protein
MQHHAREVGRSMRAEDGLGEAVRAIEALIARTDTRAREPAQASVS